VYIPSWFQASVFKLLNVQGIFRGCFYPLIYYPVAEMRVVLAIENEKIPPSLLGSRFPAGSCNQDRGSGAIRYAHAASGPMSLKRNEISQS